VRPGRWALDEQIAMEPPLSPPELPTDAPSGRMELHLQRRRPRSLASAGVVENGVVRPIEPAVKRPEHARVIIVASEGV
jgi:hypothetical protein